MVMVFLVVLGNPDVWDYIHDTVPGIEDTGCHATATNTPFPLVQDFISVDDVLCNDIDEPGQCSSYS